MTKEARMLKPKINSHVMKVIVVQLMDRWKQFDLAIHIPAATAAGGLWEPQVPQPCESLDQDAPSEDFHPICLHA